MFHFSLRRFDFANVFNQAARVAGDFFHQIMRLFRPSKSSRDSRWWAVAPKARIAADAKQTFRLGQLTQGAPLRSPSRLEAVAHLARPQVIAADTGFHNSRPIGDLVSNHGSGLTFPRNNGGLVTVHRAMLNVSGSKSHYDDRAGLDAGMTNRPIRNEASKVTARIRPIGSTRRVPAVLG